MPGGTSPVAGSSPARAVVLTVHGFNLKPAKLDDLITLMTGHGAYVVRLTLTGHNGDFAAMEQVTRDKWLRDMSCAIHFADETSRRFKLPLVFVGISLGALLEADYTNSSNQRFFAKRVYLVPAIRLNWYTSWLKALNLLPFDINISSRSPADYRVHDHLPMTAYNAVFASAAAIKDLHESNLATPTLIYASPCDELVDYQAIEAIIKEHPASPWQLWRIDNSASAVRPLYCHNAVDSTSMGADTWNQFASDLVEYLGLAGSEPPPE